MAAGRAGADQRIVSSAAVQRIGPQTAIQRIRATLAEQLAGVSARIVDLSGDFRLRDAAIDGASAVLLQLRAHAVSKL